MSPKRKFSDVDSPAMGSGLMISVDSISDSVRGVDRDAGRKRGRRNSSWRVMGDSAVPSSLPLANMTDAVRELIDPDFNPDLEDFILDDGTPRFLKPLPSRIAPEDVEYLKSKGALTIPEESLRNELLRAYVKWVYSSLPVLDLHSFLDAVATNDPDANISLLLFQAVMFAGTAFVDIRHLKAAGYNTRREARKAFFHNARLLYVFDYEDDRIPIIQSILLMTYYYEKEESLQKDIWHWAGVGYTQAQSIGLHRDPTQSNLDIHAKRLRIRLWWCLYARDRQIALALRRPTQINEGMCNVPLIGLADFDIKPFPDTVGDILLDCDYMNDRYFQRRLAVIFIEKVKLCQCLGRVLFAQYTPSNGLSGTTHETTITLVPRQASDAELQRCSQKLDAWFGNLPKEATCITSQEKKDISNGNDVLLLHSSMLQMVYHATCSALYRPRASAASSTNTSGTSRTSATAARKRVRDAASETAGTVQRLRQLGLTRYLPTYGLTVMIPAAVVHLTNSRSTNPTVRDESTWNFRLCIEIISEMRDIYPAADYETECLEKAIQLQRGQQQQPQHIMKSISVVHENESMPYKRQEAPSFLNTTALDLSLLGQNQQLSFIGQSPTWNWSESFNWEQVQVQDQDQDQDQDEDPTNDHDCWTIDLDNNDPDTDQPFFSTQNVNEDSVPPHILMIGNHDNNLHENANENGGMLQLPSQSQTPSGSYFLPSSLTQREMMITGDLERDLGFI